MSDIKEILLNTSLNNKEAKEKGGKERLIVLPAAP